MSVFESLPPDWAEALNSVLEPEVIPSLEAFLADEYASQTILPPQDEVLAALSYTARADVRVVLLGQDPYHRQGQAHGLAFSVRKEVKLPPSLRNIYKELQSDLGVEPPGHGFLKAWADRGVLLLNTSLTVREGNAGSHAKKGWAKFTDAIIEVVDAGTPAVFILWGAHARKKAKMIDTSKHVIVQSAHPSPLSAHAGFFGSKPFSATNEALKTMGYAPIDWSIPD